jgi:dTDP-glucose 4,6-dehydratase
MIFVTGAAGFIGSNFVHFLTEKTDEEIIILDKFSYAADMMNLHTLSQHKIARIDISNMNELSDLFESHKPSKVFHFAAESHVDNSIKDVMPFIESNIIGTVNLLRLSVDHKVEMFHHISTDEVYGSLGYDDPSFTEKTSYDPQNPYSASKASSDHFVMAFYNTYGLPVKITNCSNNYGPRQNVEKLIPKTITNILCGNKIPVYGKGENIRDWIYVGDHCDGIEMALTNGKTDQTYLFGGEKELRNLCDLGGRISAIRAAAQILVGLQNGLMLRSVCELSSRLDSAQRALATPRQNAQDARNRQQHAVVAARQRETAIEKLAANVAAQDAKHAVDRQNRAAIFRKPAKSEGMS